jgi:hypothetical protein
MNDRLTLNSLSSIAFGDGGSTLNQLHVICHLSRAAERRSIAAMPAGFRLHPISAGQVESEGTRPPEVEN